MLDGGSALPTEAGVHVLPQDRDASQRLMAITDIEAGTLAHVAHWLCANLLLDQIKQMPGKLYTLFEIRRIAGEDHLFPEWFSLFFTTDGGCVPIVAHKSMLDLDGMDNWVSQSQKRMRDYGFIIHNPLDVGVKIL